MIPFSGFSSWLSVVLAASAALSHEPEHLGENLLSAYWVCSVENLSAKLIESFCSWGLRDFNHCYCQWVGMIGVMVYHCLKKKKLKKIKNKKKNHNLSRCQVQLWAACRCANWLELGWFPPGVGEPSCGAMQLTTAPLLRNRRLISLVLNESVWRNCWENTKK